MRAASLLGRTTAIAIVAAMATLGHAATMPVVAADSPSTVRLVDPSQTIDWGRLVLLRDYNTRVVVLGTCFLGVGAGVVGSFTLLRKRALTADALSHATLPGIALAFIIATLAGGDGKQLSLLLLGAATTGTLGVLSILAIRRTTHIKEDAALGIVLSVFFGAGAVLMTLIPKLPRGNAAGLEGFIYGKTASMLDSDAQLIAGVSIMCLVACLLLGKELRLLCFDQAYASAAGFSVTLLDVLLMTMVVAITIVGLQAVGLVLVIALLVTPPAAARFWTEQLSGMTIIAGLIGGASGTVGSLVSAAFPRLPSGPMIVLVAAAMFAFSAMAGAKRGIIWRILRRSQVNSRIALEHLLRGVYEIAEQNQATPIQDAATSLATLVRHRSWTTRQLRQVIRRAQRKGFVRWSADDKVQLTSIGLREAARLTRQHRLWELYLVNYAEVATARVDRGADDIEHVLEASTIDRLEELLETHRPTMVPASPHHIDPLTNEHGTTQ